MSAWSADPATRSRMAREILLAIAAPPTEGNTQMLVGWMHREGGGGRWNPLNTTLRYGGSSSLQGNSAGVQNYPDEATGVIATAKTLTGGNYPNIVADLRANNPNKAGNEGPELLKWSGGGYSKVTPADTVAGTITDTPGLPNDPLNPIDAAGAAVGAVGSALSGIDAVGAFFSTLMDLHTWVRILQVAGGVGLLGVALYMLNSDLAAKATDTLKGAAAAVAVA